MPQYIGIAASPLVTCVALGAVLWAGACRPQAPGDTSGSGQDTTAAIADGRLSDPVLTDRVADTPDATSATAPSHTGAVGTTTAAGLVSGVGISTGVGTIPAGTSIPLSATVRICTSSYRPGDVFLATVTDTINGLNGAVIPAGSVAKLRVTSVTARATIAPVDRLGIALDSLLINGASYATPAGVTSSTIVKMPTGPPEARSGGVHDGPLGHNRGYNDRSTPRQTVAALPSPDDVCIPQRSRIVANLTAAVRVGGA
jgi:hypothetical protein